MLAVVGRPDMQLVAGCRQLVAQTGNKLHVWTGLNMMQVRFQPKAP